MDGPGSEVVELLRMLAADGSQKFSLLLKCNVLGEMVRLGVEQDQWPSAKVRMESSDVKKLLKINYTGESSLHLSISQKWPPSCHKKTPVSPLTLSFFFCSLLHEIGDRIRNDNV